MGWSLRGRMGRCSLLGSIPHDRRGWESTIRSVDQSSLVRAITTPAPLRGVALAAAGGAAGALHLVGVAPAWSSVAALLIGLAGVPKLGFVAAAALVPALSPVFGGGWLAWTGWTGTAIGLAAALALDRDLERRRRSRQARDATARAREVRDRLARHVERWPLLLEACLELSSARELDQFAQVLEGQARAVAPEASRVQVWLSRGDDLVCLTGAADRSPTLDELFVAHEARLLVRRQANGVRLLIPLRGDRRRDDDHPLNESGGRGVLVVDLPNSPTGEQARDLLLALGRLGGLGLAAVDLVDQARSSALHDDLTSLFGRQEFLRRLGESIAQVERAGRPLAVLALDLDHLKAINDRHGHATGDRALQAVAGSLRDAIRRCPGAIACRWGGEEFCLALPGMDAMAARELGDEVRQSLTQNAVIAPGVSVTASGGIAVWRAGETVESFLDRADTALYQAKHAGRDRVVVETAG